jgi:hypothetical protein
MAISKRELDDDFLGGQGPLTTEEEKALSEYFKKRKIVNKPSQNKRTHQAQRPKVKV